MKNEAAAEAILRVIAQRLDEAARSAGVSLVRLDRADVRIWHTDGNEAADILAALVDQSRSQSPEDGSDG